MKTSWKSGWPHNHKPSTNDEFLWSSLQHNLELRNEIEYYLNESGKISAIKHLKRYVEDNEVPVEMSPGNKCSLRELKDAIDKYAKRYTITKKIELLRDRIEKWCLENGHDKMGYQKEVKDDKTGEWTYRYSDWQMVDDQYGTMINDWDWLPHPKQYKIYNKLWKKYSNIRNYIDRSNA